MWRTLGLLFVVTVASALPQPLQKQGKSFSLFSVVSFPNDECTTTMDPTMQGICKTVEECTEDGGDASGNCASGFGVCCFTTIESAGAITNNITYIQNSGYPSSVGNTGTAAASNNQFTVTGGASICQVRLDFDTAVFQVPRQTAGTVLGVCDIDQVTVVQPAATLTGIENLCGTLTGQHLYISNDGADTAATININYNVANPVLFARSWKIKVSLLGCDNPSLAPNGCLQYFTGTGGQVTSFNGGLTGGTGEMIVNQQYSVCVRQELGMSRIQWQEARLAGNPDSFQLQDDATAETGAACDMAFVKIPSTDPTPAANANMYKFCGSVLASTDGATVASPVISNVVPFRLEVVSITPGAADTDIGQGFDLTYSQLP